MDKSFTAYALKSNQLTIKDFDDNSRKVAMYLSIFDVMDSDYDIIRNGAFSKSIQERGPDSLSNRKIAFLRYHDWQMPIGKFLELKEDGQGLYAVGELGNSTIAKDAFEDYKDGVIREHSIGFNYVKDKIKFVEDGSTEVGGYYEINEVKLWEGSAVTFGANEHTNVIDVSKGLSKETIALKAAEISSEIDTVGRALANGKGTDERLHTLEMRLKFLNSQMLTLVEYDPLQKQSLITEPSRKSFDWNQVVDKFNF